jgi:predicted CxxxxCH...CXXCH cytochrome family protein
MGTIVRNKIKGMSFGAKAGLISLVTLLLTLGVISGVFRINELGAAVNNINQWSATAVADNTTNPLTGSFTVATGTNTQRLLVVAVEYEVSAAAAHTVAVTYGTRSLTQIQNNVSQRQCIWIGYLKEQDLDLASNTTISSTITLAGGATLTRQTIHAATYDNVDQTSPILDSNATSSASATSLNYGRAITTANGGYLFYITNFNTTTAYNTTPPATTPAYTEHYDALWTTYDLECASKATTATSEASPTITLNTAANRCALVVASLRPASASNTLTVAGNTAVASGSRLDTETGVVMQRVTLTASGQLEVNSLTLNDLGTANAVASAEVYISPTQTTVLPADAVLLGSLTSWGGTSTPISLTGGTTANRTLGGTEPTTKYIYIVYDMSSGQASNTVQSSISAVGVVSPNTGWSGTALNSNTVTLTYSGNNLSTSGQLVGAANAKDSDAAVVMQHFKVDVNTAFDNAAEINSITMNESGAVPQVSAVKVYIATTEDPDATKLPAGALQIGQINDWDKTSIAIPLGNDYGATAIDRTVIAGTSKYIYVVYSMFYADDLDWPTVGKTVRNNVTAVGVASPDTGVTGLTYQSNLITLTRGIWSKITSCGGCHDTANLNDVGSRNPDPVKGQFPGSHFTHSNKSGFDCSNCHAKPTVYNHASGFINFSGLVRGGKYSRAPQDKVVVINSPYNGSYTFGTCSNVSCHNDGTGGTLQSGETRTKTYVTSPQWGTADTCYSCHGTLASGGAPAYSNQTVKGGAAKANSHQGTTHAGKQCDFCHSSVKKYTNYSTYTNHNDGYYSLVSGLSYSYAPTGGTCGTPNNLGSCHGSVVWGGSLSCVDCHSSTQLITVGSLAGQGIYRRAVATELQTSGTRNHKSTAVGAAPTKYDCIVCHMEGNMSDGSATTQHKNGVLDFRNPDTGSQIMKVRWTGGAVNTNDPGGRYVDTLTNFTTSRFKRDLSQTLESDPEWLRVASIQMNLCLKCHDYNGAVSTNARTKTSAGATFGTALQPFGNAAASTATLYSIAPARAYLTAAGNTTGAVMNVFTQLSSGNASYHPVRGRQNNSYATGSKMKTPWGNTTKSTQGTTTIYGYLLSCFDCHAPRSASGVQTAAVVAHGNTSTTLALPMMRGPAYNTAATAGAPNLCTMCHADTYGTSANIHGTGSGFAAASGIQSMSATTLGTCSNCHGSGTTNTIGARATDAHGFEGMLANGNNLNNGTGSRTYNFFRQTPNLDAWTVRTCARTGSGCTPSAAYTPGGAY